MVLYWNLYEPVIAVVWWVGLLLHFSRVPGLYILTWRVLWCVVECLYLLGGTGFGRLVWFVHFDMGGILRATILDYAVGPGCCTFP